MVDKMKMKWKILIGILAFGLVLAGFFVFSKPENSSKPENPGGDESMPVSTALPIFYSSSTVNSEEEALALFNQHIEITKENTIEKLSQSQQSQDAEIIDDMVLFSDCATVEMREWKNDQYWLGPDKSAYVIVIPAASKYENWSKKEGKIFVERTKCEGENTTLLPTNMTTYEDLKEYLNEKYPGATETYWTETKLWIKYLVDDNGTVYWAGQYLRSKPWLDY
jgi:hypothetical protein